MGDMLTQEEIEALLSGNGGDTPANEESDTPQETPTENVESGVEETVEATADADDGEDEENDSEHTILTELERDTLGEVGNICMGSAATVLHNLLDRRVNITTPVVSITNQTKLANKYDIPYVAIHVPYVEGLVGDNMLVIRTADVKAITSVLLGTDDYNDGTDTLDELHLSAISEVMNQMMGSSATAMAKLVNKKINISTPVAETVRMEDEKITDVFNGADTNLVAIKFEMEIEDLFTTEIMLLMDVEFSKEVVNGFFGGTQESEPAPQDMGSDFKMPEQPVPEYVAPTAAPAQQPAPQPMQQPPMQQQPQPMYQQPQPMYQQPMYQQPQPMYQQPVAPVNVQPVQFESFDTPMGINVGENIELLMDVPLQVTVELGRAKRTLKEILDFNVGSVITLDKLVGEPVDVVVNGKMIAKGEVVVVEDNFAVRVVDILKDRKK